MQVWVCNFSQLHINKIWKFILRTVFGVIVCHLCRRLLPVWTSQLWRLSLLLPPFSRGTRAWGQLCKWSNQRPFEKKKILSKVPGGKKKPYKPIDIFVIRTKSSIGQRKISWMHLSLLKHCWAAIVTSNPSASWWTLCLVSSQLFCCVISWWDFSWCVQFLEADLRFYYT